jgi:hypothetical protein
MKFMYGFMDNYYSLQNMSTKHKCRLGWLDHGVCYGSYSICPHLCKNFETDI